MKSSQLWAITALITNAFVWGVSWWPLRQMEGAGLHPLWATGLSFAAVLLAVTLYKPRVWQELRAPSGLWLLALASGFTNVAFNWAVTVGDVIRVVLLFYLMPAWALLVARWLLKEPITLQGLLRLALAVTGVLLVLKKPSSPWPVPSSLSDWLALGGGFTFALTNTFILKFKQSSETGRLLAMFAGGTIAALGAAVVGVSVQVVPLLPWFSIALVLAVVGLGAFFLLGNLAMQYGASRLRSSTTSLVMLTEIIFASLSSVWFGAAVLEARVLWGALLIFSAAFWAALA
ncbi:MAG: DMT family transporter [Cytophagales bacterium]|nr:DMT family transporter [Cytophagales bacterium]